MEVWGNGALGGLTVVMPLYNKARHVARALESVLAQTSGFDAIIVVDDGSTDGGAEIVETFSDPRIQLLKRSPPGPGGYAARNHAIRNARTEWIAFLDADDAWKPHFTQAIAEMAVRHGGAIGGAFTSYEMRDPDGSTRPQRLSHPADTRTPLDLDAFVGAWIRDRDSPIWTGAGAFRRDVLLAAGLFPEGRCRRGGDKDLWLRAVAQQPVAFDPRPLATYFRDSVNMVTSTVRTDTCHCIVATIQDMLPKAPAKTAALLKSLSNMETMNYCISAARSGSLNKDIYSVFYRPDPAGRGLLISALRAAPPSLRPLLGKIIARALA